ncbi:BatA domain-containing protein, partial [bacterium]|nr:BatA domain-containing protein [bacterium]
MTFMHPWLLLAGLGIALPVLAHLLNRYQVKRTQWAAMQFLNRTVRVRSRQIRLRDILLLLLRCLAVVLLVLAFARPATENAEGVASRFGERRAGVIIALDVSFSMQHSDGTSTRFERAIKKIETIAQSIHPGDPVSLILLGDEHKVVVRDMAFDPERFEAILHAQQATPGTLDLDSVPRHLTELVDDMEAPQKEIYVVTDMQEQDWNNRSAWLRDAFENLGRIAPTCVVPVPSGPDNLAITSLDLVSGVLRKGTIARYRATVRNCGAAPVANVRVKGMVNNINVDTKTIPAIAAGSSETVSLFVPFQNPGPVRVTARLEPDALPIDNSRGAVAIIRDRVSVLCVEGSSGSAEKSGGLIAAALRARGNGAGEEDFTVQSVPWGNLPTQDLNSFDVVILADVPDITPEQARRFDEYVRRGNGLIWFPGDDTKPEVWNERSALEGTPLLPAVIEQTVK